MTRTHYQCPVRWAKLKEGGSVVLINAEDFDEAQHESVEAPAEDAVPAQASQPNTLTLVEQFDVLVADGETKAVLFEFAEAHGADLGEVDSADDLNKEPLIELIRGALAKL